MECYLDALANYRIKLTGAAILVPPAIHFL